MQFKEAAHVNPMANQKMMQTSRRKAYAGRHQLSPIAGATTADNTSFFGVDPNHMKPEIFSSMMKQNAIRSIGEPDSPLRANLNLTTQNSVDSKGSYNSPPMSPKAATERK